jgi:cysteine/O-acetylserine efflux protein
MTADLLPAISYVLISTFTPGPGNISSASMAVIHGYRKTIGYQTGLATGVFVSMFISGWFSAALRNVFSAFEPIMRYAGAAYILYLALAILKASYSFDKEVVKPLGLAGGITLNLLNPKLMVYAITLFSAFLAAIATNLALLVLASVLLAAISFCATSVWALFGTVIQTHLHQPRMRTAVNVILSSSLVFTGLSLLDIP